ncbi:MAG TPA: DUF2794 domain-containing protein [Stellaceae bacterium]|nr:DUF2794 domain-containing protein [Stellaceae bacterium]
MNTVLSLADFRRRQKRIFFTRQELHQLLSIYSRQVARGEWRDYAIDQREGAAVFSVFRHTHESPLFTIVKAAPGTGRHGDFVLLQGRRRLAGGASLAEALTPLAKALGPVMVPLDGGA